nr:hypothetical protein GCM10025730_31080 [Promicromonospora thailandica]
MTTAFEPLAAGRLALRNRVVMAPMTRRRAYGTLPTTDTADYYAQRAGAGLVVTEGIQPSAIGQGYVDTPGLHTDEQVAAWRRVTDAVHEAGGTIVAQLMHTGRIGHPAITEAVGHGPLTPVAPSAVPAAGRVHTPDGHRDPVVPKALTAEDIERTIADFTDAARKAIVAGFDGVEIHGANGYLLHQFLATNTNQRTDRWGGSPRTASGSPSRSPGPCRPRSEPTAPGCGSRPRTGSATRWRTTTGWSTRCWSASWTRWASPTCTSSRPATRA